MTLNELANLGEFVGGLAVLVTLVYLAIQVRHGITSNRRNAAVEDAAKLSEFLGDLAKNGELHDIWWSGLYGERELSEKEQDRFGMLLYQVFALYNSMYQSVDLNPQSWVAFEALLDRNLRTPAVLDWWSRQAHYQPEPFRSFVEGRIGNLAGARQQSGSESDG